MTEIYLPTIGYIDDETGLPTRPDTGRVTPKGQPGDTFRSGPITVNGTQYWVNQHYNESGQATIDGLETIASAETAAANPRQPGESDDAWDARLKAAGPASNPAQDKLKAEAAKAIFEARLAEWAYENDIPALKSQYDLDKTAAEIDRLRVDNRYAGAEHQAGLAKAAADIAETKARVGLTTAQTGLTTAQIPKVGAETTQTIAQTRGTDIDNAIKVLGPLATYAEKSQAVENMVKSGVWGDPTAEGAQMGAAIMAVFDEELKTGVDAKTIFDRQTNKATAATKAETDKAAAAELARTTAEAAAKQQTAESQRQTQTNQVSAANQLTQNEATRQNTLLTATASQQQAKAQATNAYMQNYSQMAIPGATAAGFMDGLALIMEKSFGALKDVTSPAPGLGQAQGFVNSLLGGGGAPQPGPAAPPGFMGAAAAPGGVQPPGAAAPAAVEPDDALMLAGAAQDSQTQLDPQDAAQIQQVAATNPTQAMNLTVEAWKRAVRGTGGGTKGQPATAPYARAGAA